MNFNKSLMFVSTNVMEQEALELCASIGIPKTDDLGRYLGHRLIHKGRCSNGFCDLLQKVKDKLDGWKIGVLSRAPRLTLAQSVLSNMGGFPYATTKATKENPQRVGKNYQKLCLGI